MNAAKNIAVETIQNELRRIERNYGVTIIKAIESGSRAWGFHSPNSDYDIRFLYRHSMNGYLKLDEPQQVIEFTEGNYDFVGWDIKKALKLLAKGNPTLHEWLTFGNVYRTSKYAFMIEQVSEKFFNRIAVYYHYLNMAKSNYKHYIEGKDLFPAKKLLYVARPLLIRRYVERFDKKPPVNLYTVIDRLPVDTMSRTAWNDLFLLLNSKRNGMEMGEVNRDKYTYLLHWCEKEFEQAQQPKESGVVGKRSDLNDLFFKVVTND